MKARLFQVLALIGIAMPSWVHAEITWTPLISSAFFDGVQADMTTAVVGILGLGLIIFGLVMLYRVISR